jgi:DNA-binding MarR family transcriptional regulator
MADMRDILEGLFTEAAMIEHLTRFRIESKYIDGFSVGHFGILGHFTRGRDAPDSIAGIAWSFQEDEARVTAQVMDLAERGYVLLSPGLRPGDTMVSITEIGRAARQAQLDKMEPDFLQLVSEIPPADVETAYRVLREIRLVMDNLPDR